MAIDELSFDEEPLIEDEDGSIQSLIASGIVQQSIRTQADGYDQIHGIFRCDFASDQDRNALHIPIHPPLANIPTVEAFALERDARIRVTDRQKYGVRMEIVLNEKCADNPSVFVDVVVSSPT